MLEKYNVNKFYEFMSHDPTDEQIHGWFAKMNKEYKKQKKEGLITDDIMFGLVSFWMDIREEYDENILMILLPFWPDEPPMVVKDIVEWTAEYHKRTYEMFVEKMDAVEVKETETLFDAIWNRNQRFEGSITYFDWDADSVFDTGITVPRDEREPLYYDFKLWCAKIIYNRGSIVVKFYANRGKFEVACILVDGDGHWYCIDESAMSERYVDGEGKPVTLKSNERMTFFEREEVERPANAVYFKKK